MHFMLMYVHTIFVHRQCFQQLYVCRVYIVDNSNGSSQIKQLCSEFLSLSLSLSLTRTHCS